MDALNTPYLFQSQACGENNNDEEVNENNNENKISIPIVQRYYTQDVINNLNKEISTLKNEVKKKQCKANQPNSFSQCDIKSLHILNSMSNIPQNLTASNQFIKIQSAKSGLVLTYGKVPDFKCKSISPLDNILKLDEKLSNKPSQCYFTDIADNSNSSLWKITMTGIINQFPTYNIANKDGQYLMVSDVNIVTANKQCDTACQWYILKAPEARTYYLYNMSSVNKVLFYDDLHNLKATTKTGKYNQNYGLNSKFNFISLGVSETHKNLSQTKNHK